ncbi:MAG: tryptophan synthase subunit alpha [Armatimonadota bacterium]|nr:tryptophan synthase subunit alpha [Armatimonadota bacterium]
MSQRLDQTFARLKDAHEGALVNFITAGDPSVENTPTLVASLAEAGADIVELGIPYSDPLADGPTVQASSQRALDRGVTPDTVLQMIRDIRTKTQVPLVLMTSYNLALKYGLERFAQIFSEAGADGTILTDLPPEEAGPWKAAADGHGLATIFLVAPTSTPERIALIAKNTTGFVYCVSRTGVTGARTELPTELRELLERIRQATDKPICVGFGVSQPKHVRQVIEIADGAVIGSALVDFLHTYADNPDQASELTALVGRWKEATRRA